MLPLSRLRTLAETSPKRHDMKARVLAVLTAHRRRSVAGQLEQKKEPTRSTGSKVAWSKDSNQADWEETWRGEDSCPAPPRNRLDCISTAFDRDKLLLQPLMAEQKERRQAVSPASACLLDQSHVHDSLPLARLYELRMRNDSPTFHWNWPRGEGRPGSAHCACKI